MPFYKELSRNPIIYNLIYANHWIVSTAKPIRAGHAPAPVAIRGGGSAVNGPAVVRPAAANNA